MTKNWEDKVIKSILAGDSNKSKTDITDQIIIGLYYLDNNTFTINISNKNESIKSINDIKNLKEAIKTFEIFQIQYFKKVLTKKEEYDIDYKEEFEKDV